LDPGSYPFLVLIVADQLEDDESSYDYAHQRSYGNSGEFEKLVHCDGVFLKVGF
jgi:hypothetical protein